MMGKIRWGLLSTAGINDALIRPIQEAERSELYGVASRNLENAQSYASTKGFPKAYGSYEALLADPDIDVIYNPLPNTLHSVWTLRAIEAGKHVLCEKPLVVTTAELDAVEIAAREQGVTVFEAFMYLHHPQTIQVREMIASGKLGNLQTITSWFHFYLPAEDSENIRLNPQLAGGALWDVGVYPNSMSIVMAGGDAPQEVVADKVVGETGVDVAMRGHMRFANGVVAQVSSGFRSPFREGVHLIGDEGMVILPQPWKPGLQGKDSHILFTDRAGNEEDIVVPSVNPYSCEVAAMEACVLDGAEPIVPLSLSRNFLRSALAMLESADSGEVVRL